MPRAPRNDTPGSWHHVMGRGIAKRTIFECRDDFRYFLALLALEVRRGVLEVHAFALMQTHYHLLVRSPLGQLPKAMERVLRNYSRWFNRRRRRDGALFAERFKSKLVDHHAYRSLLVRYIDDNPVKARLAPHSAAYPFGSAFQYAQRQGPVWLERTWVEDEVKGVRGRLEYRPEDYSERFPSRLPGAICDWIDHRIQSPHTDPIELLAPHEQSQIDWMVRKALLADGTEPFRLPLPTSVVEQEFARLRTEEPGLAAGSRSRDKDDLADSARRTPATRLRTDLRRDPGADRRTRNDDVPARGPAPTQLGVVGVRAPHGARDRARPTPTGGGRLSAPLRRCRRTHHKRALAAEKGSSEHEFAEPEGPIPQNRSRYRIGQASTAWGTAGSVK